MPGAMDLCSFGFVLSFRNKFDSLKKRMEMYKGISMRFFFLLHVFDIFRSVLTNYKMILLLSIQFHGFRLTIRFKTGHLEQSAKRYSVSGAGKPTLTIRRSNQVKSLWNRGNQLILDANTPFTQDGFHLCPHLLNGIQIRAIWRQIERYCTFCSNQFAHKIAMMRSEIVHNDIVEAE